MIDSTLKLLIKKEKIKDCGYTANPDREKILTLAPDAVLMSPYDGMQTTGFYGATEFPWWIALIIWKIRRSDRLNGLNFTEC